QKVFLADEDRFAREAQQREDRDRQDQEEPRRPNVAASPAGQVFARQEARTEQQRKKRAPHASVKRDVTARRVAQHAAHGRQGEARLLTAIRAIRGVRDRAAIPARVHDGRLRDRSRRRCSVSHAAEAATCTAAARLSDASPGAPGIVATIWQRASSSLESPDISPPNTSATSPRSQWRTASAAASRAERAAPANSRGRAVKPIASVAPASPASSESTTLAALSSAAAPEARAMASGCGNARGATSVSRDRPIVLMARAQAPILPGWLGSHSTTRMRSSGGCKDEVN